jgi:hypothetical protein
MTTPDDGDQASAKIFSLQREFIPCLINASIHCIADFHDGTTISLLIGDSIFHCLAVP